MELPTADSREGSLGPSHRTLDLTPAHLSEFWHRLVIPIGKDSGLMSSRPFKLAYLTQGVGYFLKYRQTPKSGL